MAEREFDLAFPPAICISFKPWFTNVWILSDNTDFLVSQGFCFCPGDFGSGECQKALTGSDSKMKCSMYIFVHMFDFYLISETWYNLSCTINLWFWCSWVDPLQYLYRHPLWILLGMVVRVTTVIFHSSRQWQWRSGRSENPENLHRHSVGNTKHIHRPWNLEPGLSLERCSYCMFQGRSKALIPPSLLPCKFSRAAQNRSAVNCMVIL